MPMRAATFAYGFQPGTIYNLEASAIISNGGGASGAHSDIAHPEVAHAFWVGGAVVAPLPPTGTLSPGGGGRGVTRAAVARRPARRRRAARHAADRRSAQIAAAAAASGREHGPLRSRRADARRRSGHRASPLPRAASAARARPGRPSRRRRRAARSAGSTSRSRTSRATRPLAAGKWYTLALDVDIAQHADALTTAPFADASLFPAGVDEIEVTVQLDSADFDIPDPIRPLRVPRAGKSRNKARFEISPLHDGASTLTATLHKDGNFLQSIAITFVVGGTRPVPVETTARGRPPSAASVLRPRDIGVCAVARATAATTASSGARSPRARACRCSRRFSPARSRRCGAS